MSIQPNREKMRGRMQPTTQERLRNRPNHLPQPVLLRPTLFENVEVADGVGATRALWRYAWVRPLRTPVLLRPDLERIPPRAWWSHCMVLLQGPGRFFQHRG